MKQLPVLDSSLGAPAIPDVSVVIPTYNNVRYTAQCFASLARNTDGLTYEIIVVDNGSEDETISFVASHTPGQLAGAAQGANPPKRVELLINPEPRALAKSWNMGIAAARGKYLLISNNDVCYAPGAIAAMITIAERERQIGIVLTVGPGDLPHLRYPGGVASPPLLSPVLPSSPVSTLVSNLESVEDWARRTKVSDAPESLAYVSDPLVPQGGYCFLLTRACRDTVGAFDESYDLTGEDWDYFCRTRRHFKIARSLRSYVEHFEHVTCETLGDEYHERLCRNRFRLTEKQQGIMELFSVIMPVYNRVESLEAAIDSVLAQTFPHWRLYVVDDGSDDWDRISELAKRRYWNEAGRVHFFHRKRNAGPAAARNYGLSQCRGKYVAFLDSDDLWYRDHLQVHFAAHEAGNWTGVYGTPDFAWRSKDPVTGGFSYRPDKHPTIEYDGNYDAKRLCDHNYIQTSALSLWGDQARAHRFPEHLRVEEDWEYFKEVFDAGGNEGFGGRPVLHSPGRTCRYHISRSATEEDHLIRRVAAGRLASQEAALPADAGRMARIPFSDAQLYGRVAKALVGVVVPTRDRVASTLPAALAGINTGNETLPVVVVDDGSVSAESVAQAVGHYASGEGALFALLRCTSSLGASAARNRGVDYLPATWIRFLDDDDILSADWHAALLPHLLADDADVIICPAWVPHEDGNGYRIDRDVYTSQVCVRRSVFLAVGGFTETLSWAEERDLIDRMVRQAGARVKHLPLPGVTRPRKGNTGDPATAPKVVHPVFTAAPADHRAPSHATNAAFRDKSAAEFPSHAVRPRHRGGF